MDEKEKLHHLLEHWVEHNEEHAAEFREWADKAKTLGETAVSDDILEAAKQLEKANEFLSKASEQMSGS